MGLIVLRYKNNCVVYIQYFIKGVLKKKKAFTFFIPAFLPYLPERPNISAGGFLVFQVNKEHFIGLLSYLAHPRYSGGPWHK